MDSGKGDKAQRITAAIAEIVKVVDAQVDAINKGGIVGEGYNAISEAISQKLINGLGKDDMGENVFSALNTAIAAVYVIDEKTHDKNKDLTQEQYDALKKICEGLKPVYDMAHQPGSMKEKGGFSKAAKMLIGGLLLLGCAMIAAAVGATLPVALPAAISVSPNVALGAAGGALVSVTGLCTIAYNHHLTKTDLSKAIVDHGKTVTEGLKLLETEMNKTVGDDAGRTV